MTDTTQVEVAGTPAPVALEDTKHEDQNTPEVTAAEGEVEKEEQVESKTKTFTQEEVDTLVQKRLAKERRNEARRLERQLREAQQASQLKAPERENFRDEETYTQAQIEHLAAQRAEQILAERKTAEEMERRATTFQEKAELASEKYPDFDLVVGNPTLPINDAMAEFIAESDAGPDLAYHLGKNPAIAAKIARLSPVQAARELIRIEAELAAKPKPPTPSKAPEPIEPIGSSRAAVQKDPADMTQAEFNEYRRKQIARRGR